MKNTTYTISIVKFDKIRETDNDICDISSYIQSCIERGYLLDEFSGSNIAEYQAEDESDERLEKNTFYNDETGTICLLPEHEEYVDFQKLNKCYLLEKSEEIQSLLNSFAQDGATFFVE